MPPGTGPNVQSAFLLDMKRKRSGEGVIGDVEK
jgi:hypothetical protein